jgi:lipoate-protein ligase B
MKRHRAKDEWLLVELPSTEYTKAYGLQLSLVDARSAGTIDRNVVLVLEHPPVFTLGRRGGLGNLTVPEGLLERAGIPLVHVERGGDITFHGPGQLVAYPLIDLRAARLGVSDYVGALEEVMIRVAAQWGIEAGRNALNRGVWAGDRKLGSIGIAIRRGISFHGLALNVNISLEPFEWINPCGLRGTAMTSMERELSSSIPMDRIRNAVKEHMEKVFGVRLVAAGLIELGIEDFEERPSTMKEGTVAHHRHREHA